MYKGAGSGRVALIADTNFESGRSDSPGCGDRQRGGLLRRLDDGPYLPEKPQPGAGEEHYGHPGEAAFEPELIHVLVEDVRENGLRAA
jgi:hypothetical protein